MRCWWLGLVWERPRSFASGIVLGGSGVATWARLAFTGLGCGMLGLALGVNLDLWLLWALTGAVLVCAVAMMLSLPAALDQVTDARLRTDLRSRELLTAGLVAGDLRVAASTGGTVRRFFRGSRLALGSHSWLNAVSVDALTLVRRPFRLMGALLISFCAGAVVTVLVLIRCWWRWQLWCCSGSSVCWPRGLMTTWNPWARIELFRRVSGARRSGI